MKKQYIRSFYTAAFSMIIFLAAVSGVQAASVSYTFDNIVLDNGEQLTGAFEWTYVEGDFENGSGLFSDLFIPGNLFPLSDLNTTFDIGKSIEITLNANLDSAGVDITLFFLQGLTPDQGSEIDLDRSKFNVGGGGFSNSFVSGSIIPTVVPVPAAVWLFGSGFLGLLGVARRKKI